MTLHRAIARERLQSAVEAVLALAERDTYSDAERQDQLAKLDELTIELFEAKRAYFEGGPA